MTGPASWALAAALGLAAGSVPFGLLIARLAGRPDPRRSGSGNVGATNVARTGGLPLGLLTLVLDAAKGFLPPFLLAPAGELAACLAALAAVIGHCYSPWLGGRGGKGVATLLGAALALAWPEGALGFVVTWLVVFLALRYASVASLAASWVLPFLALATSGARVALTLGAAALLVTWRHAANIGRLHRGEESRWRGLGRAGGPPGGGP